MTYRGNTPPQLVAHIETILRAEQVLGTDRFLQGQHLVLAGPAGGDISTLLGFGVPAGHIVALERDDKAYAQVHFRFPDVHILQEDVVHFAMAPKHEKSFDFIFVDQCAQLTEANILAISYVASHLLAEGGVVAYAFLAGREQDTQGGLRRRVLDARTRIQAWEVRSKALLDHVVGRSIAMARVAILQEELTLLSDRHIVPTTVLYYKSRAERDKKGMPMCIYIGQMEEGPSPWKRTDVLPALLNQPPEFRVIRATEHDVGPVALAFENLGYSAALLMNVPQTTVSAWKAHASRGSYRKKRKKKNLQG